MKRTILSLLVYVLVIQFSFAQQSDYVDGDSFRKEITYNTHGGKDVYNTNLKDDFDHILFGNSNFFVEYVYYPSFDDALALSITQDTTLGGNYIMKIMRLADSNKIMADVRESVKEMVLPYSIPTDSMMTFQRFCALTAEKYTFRDADAIMNDILRNMMPITMIIHLFLPQRLPIA